MQQTPEAFGARKVIEKHAGDGEFLPHEQPELVTQIIECLLFPAAAAPYTQEVDPGLPGLVQQRLVMAAPGPAPERVHRHPVGAAQEQRLAVDDQPPWMPTIGALSLDLSHAKAGRKNVEQNGVVRLAMRSLAGAQADRQLVQARLAALPWLPKPRGCQVEA